MGRELHPAAPPEPPITTPHPVTDADTPVFGAESPAAATPAALPRADAVANRTSSHHPRETGSAASARAERHRPGSTAPGRSVAASSAARLAATLLSAPAAPASGHAPSAVLEIGAGTGYYLGAVLDAVAGARGVALDVSKAAARRAARAHGRAGSVLADAWRGLPVRDGVMGAVVSVFAPRNAEEVARVLAAQGRFVVVTPTARHLGELIEPLGMVSVDAAKENRLAESLGERFELVGRDAVEYEMALSHEDVANVAAMGPSAFHLAEGRAERIAALPDPMPVTASVTISVYRLR
uniref:methyltransferase domain-containing protein n=1 Tax=Nocardia niigatensis TaxID=209249 RepID=UPI0035712055